MRADYREKIIEELGVLQRKEAQERNVFKARAYGKVVESIRAMDAPVASMSDLAGVEGIGEKIRAKIEEILATGHLKAADDIKNDSALNMAEVLTGVYGIGPVKAKSILSQHAVRSIAQFRELVAREPKLLNDKQKIGLRHYEDLRLRIPRGEMEGHERRLKDALGTGLFGAIVGSFRRGAEDSGDIDMLVGYNEHLSHKEASTMFGDFVQGLVAAGYVTDVLAQGDKKFMGVCMLDPKKPARRIDLLLTTPAEYPFALLYFTGSDKYNIRVRQHALERGYTLNEHGLGRVKDDVPEPPRMASEHDILAFLGLPFIAPDMRA